ncbi:7-deoxyloganetic acid glucosyltransferase-like [Dorcoceras hygrometricum]|uniref:7-deoxyloganetic acid glucosyltransferase-like n=1 Tax=Dorcoceras hygrometricum TaxID=472368 RepID=A0A2Z7BB10_9LAMI|nr:7-deoxyloganetic acid glucosyltransferase-like [Dorcoceras hygrometricum]
MPRYITSEPDDRSVRSKYRHTPRAREHYPVTYVESSGGSPEENATFPRVQPVYTSLKALKVTENHGDDLAQDDHQSCFEGLDHPSLISSPDDPTSPISRDVAARRLKIRLHHD